MPKAHRMSDSSLLTGLYRLTLAERRHHVAQALGIDITVLEQALCAGGLDPATADKIVENVLGTYALPFAVAPHFLVNGAERLAAMVVEEPSVVAAASSAAQRIKRSGGFVGWMAEELMTTQVEVHTVPNLEVAQTAILTNSAPLLELARAAVPGLVARGGGPRELSVRKLSSDTLVVHVEVDCCDAMGANLVNAIAETIGPRVAELAQGELGLRILTNLCDRRRVIVKCEVGFAELADRDATEDSGRKVAEAIASASRFAELDVYRATTHNKGFMNGLDSVVLATGNDLRAVEAGAHAFAARSGRYRPLSTWKLTETGLAGEVELPLALGTVGGTIRVHPTARLALALMRIAGSGELAILAASVGLASNLSALRALGTRGIQANHMTLHARSVAVEAGAVGDQVERVASLLVSGGRINLESARAILACEKGE